MTLYTSRHFASYCAAGTDWRDTARMVLEELQTARIEGDGFNIGFLYITDILADDAHSILGLFQSVTGIEHWIGSVGLGVCATGQSYLDAPAISAMIGRLPQDGFAVFPAVDYDITDTRRMIETFAAHNEAPAMMVHGNPLSEIDPFSTLIQLEQVAGSFIFGGMASSRGAHVYFADQVMRDSLAGAVFSSDVKIVTALTQGCAPLGKRHVITSCEDNVIMTLDGRPAYEVLADELKVAAMLQSQEISEQAVPSQSVPDRAQEDRGKADIILPDNNHSPDEFQGEVHIAFPVTGSDMHDYMVRNAIGVDPDNGWIAVAQHVHEGEQMLFVHRDDETVQADLSRTLLDIRQRVTTQYGEFNPQGGIYISCVARTMCDFGGHPDGELGLVREVIGDIPLAGFYANGEISNHRLYGYTGVLILFI